MFNRRRRSSEGNSNIANKNLKTAASMYSSDKGYYDTNYLVCSHCIKAFKTIDGYEKHVQSLENKKDHIVMKVFREVPEIPDGRPIYNTFDDNLMDSKISANTIKFVTNEMDDQQLYLSLALVKSGLPETFPDKMQYLEFTIETLSNGKITFKNPRTLMVDVFRTCIKFLANNLKQQILEGIAQSSHFALQIAEFGDIKYLSVLIVTVRYKNAFEIKEEILLCQRISPDATPREYFKIINDFFIAHDMNWHKCVGICMDGVQADSGQLEQFMSHFENLQDFSPKYTNVFLRRAAFIEKYLPPTLKQTLTDAIQIINILKQDDTLKFSCEMIKGFEQILLHTDNYWLSYSHLLSHLYDQHETFSDRPDMNAFRKKLNSKWLIQLAYLADLFGWLIKRDFLKNSKELSIFDIYDQITAMMHSLESHKTNLDERKFLHLSDFQRLISNRHLQDHPDVIEEIQSHLRRLKNCLHRYLPISNDEKERYAWINSPFNIDSADLSIGWPLHEMEMLLRLTEDESAKLKHDEEHLEGFWTCIAPKYPFLSDKALQSLLTFKNSRLSELAFSTFVDVRTQSLTNQEYEAAYVQLKLSDIQLNCN